MWQVQVHMCVCVCVADITATLLAFDEAPKRIFQLRGSCGKLTNGNSDVATGNRQLAVATGTFCA